MNIYTKLVSVACISGLLTACGGGSGGGDQIPDNVPGKIIPPGLTEDFVPFEGKSVLEKIKDFLSGNTESSVNEKYNQALGQMVAEAFADYPLARTGKVVDLYNLGVNNAKYNLNAICSTITKVGNTSTMVLRDGQKNCIRGENTFRAGSKIEVTEDGSITTVTFTNVRYGSNIDFNLKDEYLVNGTLKRSSLKLTNYDLNDYEVPNKLEFQRITPSQSGEAKSLEYIQLSNYKYSEEVSDSIKTMKTRGKIIGQPYNQDFSYDFDFETLTPFEVSRFNHLPNSGELIIYDIFRRYSFGIKQTQPRSLNATVTFQGNEIKPLLWSQIVSKK
ncbi:MAG: hypothetical protein H9855_00815 [Candidatus Acinetobacter avistercoris]|uniref:hypothetical protein n=1 Tax=Acinetobacter sp. KS-LM10 TaxID=3120518 RepID=UPI001F99D150|nr:hypothetical protein [Candidatus Acinetobacter avistercoris]